MIPIFIFLITYFYEWQWTHWGKKTELEDKDWEKRKMRYHHSVTNSRFMAVYFIALTTSDNFSETEA